MTRLELLKCPLKTYDGPRWGGICKNTAVLYCKTNNCVVDILLLANVRIIDLGIL